MAKQLFYIDNDGSEIPQPILSLCIGDNHVSFAVTDRPCSRLYYLAYYSVDDTSAEDLSSIWSDHTELHRSFDEVQVCFDHSRNIFVPVQHYSEATAPALLDSIHGRNGTSTLMTEIVNEWQLVNVYAVPLKIQEWIQRKFPTSQCRHHFTLGIKRMPADHADRLLVDIHTKEFSFIAIKENKLLLAQTHQYSSPADIVYYLLKACHQFSLSQEKAHLLVSGLVEKESQLYRELYQFFVHTELRKPTWDVPSTAGDECPSHFFTTLNDLARCAS
ncbi:MAG: DUF3822 family protein [Chitinophagaceae bacterium]|nr:DUF3822 family protein [Chitinophagaceae bacterium]